MRNINKILTFFIKVTIILSLTLNRMLIKQQF